MGEPGRYYAKWNKRDTEGQILYATTSMKNLKYRLTEAESRMMLPGPRGKKNGEVLVKGYNVLVLQDE